MIYKERTESGRSMVEMLGVLAIIGVISIGAIAGYTYGMNRYRTNEILDGGTKRAYTVATQLSMGLEPNLSEFKDYNTTAGGTFGDTDGIKQWDGEFGISISGVTKPVCENLIRMIGDNTPLRALSKGDGENETELTAGNCADENNDFYLVYNIGGVGSSSSSSGGGYCAANPDKCTSCGSGSNSFSCGVKGIGESRMDYDDAEAYCVEQGGMLVTASDLGCTALGQACNNASGPAGGNSGAYWVVNDIGADIDSTTALLVFGGTLASTIRNEYTRSGDSPQPLCK